MAGPAICGLQHCGAVPHGSGELVWKDAHAPYQFLAAVFGILAVLIWWSLINAVLREDDE